MRQKSCSQEEYSEELKVFLNKRVLYYILPFYIIIYIGSGSYVMYRRLRSLARTLTTSYGFTLIAVWSSDFSSSRCAISLSSPAPFTRPSYKTTEERTSRLYHKRFSGKIFPSSKMMVVRRCWSPSYFFIWLFRSLLFFRLTPVMMFLMHPTYIYINII